MLKEYSHFIWRAFVLSFSGSRLFYAWMAGLSVLVIIGGNAYTRQFVHGLAVTGMTDQVAWGAYIANFTFLVGVAAASVMMVIPAYVYRIKAMHDVVLFGELLSLVAIIMSLIFVVVDLGRPDRFWHMIPFIGKFNFPQSLLAWDVVALVGYLLINLHICGYLLYRKYQGRKPTWFFYLPFIFLSIVWAISTHTATAFLYVGLVGRPFWNASIIAPRFLVSAFVSGPAIMIIALQVIGNSTAYDISKEVYLVLRRITTVALLIGLFLLGSELFKEFYSGGLHSASARYLYLGIEHQGHYYGALVPWIWTSIAFQSIALVLLMMPAAQQMHALNLACALAIVGVWIEKGLGLLIPGFLPTPLGNIVEYQPSLNEILVCVGIWAFGFLLYSWLLHLAVPILTGKFSFTSSPIANSQPGATHGELNSA